MKSVGHGSVFMRERDVSIMLASLSRIGYYPLKKQKQHFIRKRRLCIYWSPPI